MKEKEHKIGECIAGLRKEKGWTQVELAEKLQVSDKAISKWESNKGEPSLEFLPKLAQLFNVTIDYIMTGKKQSEKKEATSKIVIPENFSKKYEQEKLLCVHDGLLNVDELLKIDDFNTIKEMLETYPINYGEMLADMIDKKQYKELFQFIVDNDLPYIDDVLTQNYDKLKKSFVAIFYSFNNQYNQYNYNKAVVDLIKKQSVNNKYLIKRQSYGMISTKANDILSNIKTSKSKIVENVGLKQDKEKITNGLTKEYFLSELEKNNIDIVVIKLCVKLEAILKCDYKYTGDFNEMLNKYCSIFEVNDDEDDNYDPYTPALLNKLRKYRNGLVHAEVTNETISITELKSCIDYICKLG